MSLVVTVVGATGHVGAPIVEALLARHIAVRAVARGAERLAPGLAVVTLRPGFFMDNLLAAIPIVKTAGVYNSSTRGDVPIPNDPSAATRRS